AAARASDQLYDLCVDEPRRENRPIRVDYAEPRVAGDPPPGDAGRVEDTNPIGSLIRIGLTDLPPAFDPLTIPVTGTLPNRWVMEMNRRYPGMFDGAK